MPPARLWMTAKAVPPTLPKHLGGQPFRQSKPRTPCRSPASTNPARVDKHAAFQPRRVRLRWGTVDARRARAADTQPAWSPVNPTGRLLRTETGAPLAPALSAHPTPHRRRSRTASRPHRDTTPPARRDHGRSTDEPTRPGSSTRMRCRVRRHASQGRESGSGPAYPGRPVGGRQLARRQRLRRRRTPDRRPASGTSTRVSTGTRRTRSTRPKEHAHDSGNRQVVQ